MLSRAAVAILLGGVLVTGIRASRPHVARGAAPGELISLSLWPAGKGRIEVTQNGLPVTLTTQNDVPIVPPASCDFLFLLGAEDACKAIVVAGTPVTLKAVTEPDVDVPPGPFTEKLPDFADNADPAFKRWTVFGCDTTNPCTFTPDTDRTWIGAIFTPLQLEVGINGAGTVHVQRPDGTFDPAFTCSSPLDSFGDSLTCHGLYDADTPVKLVGSPDVMDTPFAWTSGCEPAGQPPSCMVEMTNLRTFAGVGFGVPAPGFPFDITPQVSLVLGGSGHGRVAGSIDCDSRCEKLFVYQDRVTLQAIPDSGSQFVRWQGVCSTAPSCSFSAGSATVVGAVFDVLPPPPQTTSAVTATVVTEPGRPAFRPRVGKVGTRHRAGRRIVVVPLVLDRAARVTLRLSRRGRTVLLKRLTAQRGRTLLQLPIPMRLKRGGYTLLVRIVAGTDARTFSTSVAIGR